MKTTIANARIITPYRVLDGSVVFEDGKLVALQEGGIIPQTDIVLDAKGMYLTPGFIDLHSHGGGGHDYMDAIPEAYIGAAKTHMMYGTTTITPTTLSDTMEDIVNSVDAYNKAKGHPDVPYFAGLHLEGPYFSYEQRGAQDPRFIKNPDKREYLPLLDRFPSIRRWSIAPELPGALEMGMELRRRDIIASMAHTNAMAPEVFIAMEHGFTMVTHFYSCFNGMKRIREYRHTGAVEAIYLLEDCYVEIIADGKHLPVSMLQYIYKTLGSGRICLVTDSCRSAGTDEKTTILGRAGSGIEVIIEDGVAKQKDRTSFAGSIATGDRLVRTMYKLANIPLQETIKMITTTPARIARIDDIKGTITPGKDADLVVFDDDITIKLVVCGGKIVKNDLPEG